MNIHSGVIERVTPVARTQWVWHLGMLAVIAAAILAMFQYEVLNAVEVWWVYPTYSHCFLILPISAWLIWEKRDELATMVPAIAPKALLAIPLIMMVWFAGKIATINEVRQFAVIALIDVAILALLGPQIFRAILFPAFYLFFLVPFGQYLIPPMQQFAARFTDIGLTLLGIVHYTEGTVIEVPNATFEIAEACAGLRFLIATVALGVLFAHLAYTKLWKVGAFLSACVVIPLIANGLRCIGIIALGYYTNNVEAIEADHIVYGWGFNVAILVGMYLGGMWFRDPPKETVWRAPARVSRLSQSAVWATAAALLMGVASGPALAYWQERRAVSNIATLQMPSVGSATWTAMPPSGRWTPYFASADQELKFSLSGSLAGAASRADVVDVAVLYYARIREDHSLIASTNRLWDATLWHGLGSNSVTACIGSVPVRFTETILGARSDRRIVWSTYWADGQFTPSGTRIKFQQLKSVFFGREAVALVAISTPMNANLEDTRRTLASALAALGDLPEHLNAADGVRSNPTPNSTASISQCAASLAGSTP